jgi:hypothetical protein
MNDSYRLMVPLDVRLHPGTPMQGEVLREIRYLSPHFGRAFTVPVGFRTDFASVPRLPLAYALVGNAAHIAALFHDYQYQYAILSREDADTLFEEIMDFTGEPRWRSAIMWAGVRVFGEGHYKGEDGSLRAEFSLVGAGADG